MKFSFFLICANLFLVSLGFSEIQLEDFDKTFDKVAIIIKQDGNLNFITLKGEFDEINPTKIDPAKIDADLHRHFPNNGVFLFLKDSVNKLSMIVPVSGTDTADLLKKGYDASLKNALKFPHP
jgi:hypothetical protein